MGAFPGEDWPATADPGPDASLRMRAADAAFVADGLALGLLLKWAEWAQPPADGMPRVRARGAPGGGMRASADH
jgi:hypothetical protein